MSDVKAKIHPIRFPLELRPRLRCESLQRSTRSHSSTSSHKERNRKGRGGERGREGDVRRGVERWGERGDFGPPKNIGMSPNERGFCRRGFVVPPIQWRVFSVRRLRGLRCHIKYAPITSYVTIGFQSAMRAEFQFCCANERTTDCHYVHL